MPYIKLEDRPKLDIYIDNLIAILNGESKMIDVDGKLNYIITRLLKGVYQPPKYYNYNRAIGMLECVKQEYYCREISPYEDKKRIENGEVV